jgi:hypothetical protein
MSEPTALTRIPSDLAAVDWQTVLKTFLDTLTNLGHREPMNALSQRRC